MASVFFSSDVANPDTYPHFYTDLQMYTTTMTQPDPEIFMSQFRRGRSRTKDEQVAGPQHHALAERGIRQAYQAAEGELDPVKRAALFIQMNDLVDAATRRSSRSSTGRGVAAVSANKLVAADERLGQQLLGSAGLVQARPEVGLAASR